MTDPLDDLDDSDETVTFDEAAEELDPVRPERARRFLTDALKHHKHFKNAGEICWYRRDLAEIIEMHWRGGHET
jgi:hypothetical protein